MNSLTLCRWCGQNHLSACPSVRSIEYFEDGFTVRKVEFREPAPVYYPYGIPTTHVAPTDIAAPPPTGFIYTTSDAKCPF